MIKSKKIVFILLLIPSLTLGVLAFYKSQLLSSGEEVELSISGYDPRDLLAGHYLTYTIDYGVKINCENSVGRAQNAFVCLEPLKFTFIEPGVECRQFIRGQCQYGRFEAGIERFYIPEEKASELEKIVLKNKSKIKISILSSGTAMVKDIIFVE